MNPQAALRLLIEALRKRPIKYTVEKRTQAEIGLLFSDLGIEFISEHYLGQSTGWCDFFIPRSGIGVEVKAFKNWSKKRVYRQCERYCQHPDIKGLLLVTGKAQGLPSEINGKPVLIFQLGVSAL